MYTEPQSLQKCIVFGDGYREYEKGIGTQQWSGKKRTY